MEQRLYDLTGLEKATDGDKEFLNNMVQLILVDTPIDLLAMETALKNADYTNVLSIAHKIKPSIKYICIQQLFEEILAIEKWEENDAIMAELCNRFVANIYLALTQLKNI
jgi:HPt (histidine-containing phosphotransfer) domain-containing protein